MRLSVRCQIPSSVSDAVFVKVQRDIAALLPSIRASMATALLEALKQEARSQLRSTYAAYVAGLPVQTTDDGEHVTVRLQGTLPEMLERGFAAFDMKPGLLRGAKTSKTGKAYRDVQLGKTGQFRRVSEKSAAASWRHPGYSGLHLFEVVPPRIEDHLRKVIARDLAAKGYVIK